MSARDVYTEVSVGRGTAAVGARSAGVHSCLDECFY